MLVYRTNIYLDPEQMRALKHLAAEDETSVAELVRRAVDSYLATRLANEHGWQERLDDFLARVRARLPQDLPPGEIEADITAAADEARVANRAPRRR
jgi:hypothetical protein